MGGKTRFEGVHALRALAAGLVALAHLFAILFARSGAPLFAEVETFVSRIGGFGVDLFFVISGFVIYSLTRDLDLAPWSGASARVAAAFFMRRVFRIYPLFWAALAVALLWRGTEGLTLSNVVLAKTPDQLAVAWTLVFEIYFYLNVTVLILLFGRGLKAALVPWSILQAAMFVAGHHLGIPLPYFPPALTGEFIIGMGVAAIAIRPGRFADWAALAVAAIYALALSCGLLAGEVVGELSRLLTWGIPAGFILYVAVRLEPVLNGRIPTPVMAAADVSYSTYLWHTLVFTAVVDLMVLGGMAPTTTFGLAYLVLGVLAVAVVSLASFRWIETPPNRLAGRLSRWIRERPDRAPATGVAPAIGDRVERTLRGMLEGLRLSPGGFLGLVLVVFAVYGAQAIMPAYNGDDYAHIQYAGAAQSFFESMRWGYYFVYAVLQGLNPLPIVSTAVAAVVMVATYALAARAIGFSNPLVIGLFVLVASISLFWQENAGFDSTRIAYPLGNLLAVLGVWLCLRRRWVAGIVAMAFAPSLYTASCELAATLVLAIGAAKLMRERWWVALRDTVAASTAVLASLVLFMAITGALYWLIGRDFPFGRGDRTIEVDAIFARFDQIVAVLLTHALPVINWDGLRGWMQGAFPEGIAQRLYYPYFGDLTAAALLIAFAVFSAVSVRAAFRRNGWIGAVLMALSGMGLLVAPFFLAFANDRADFSSRSFFAYSLVHAFWLAAVLQPLLAVPATRRPLQATAAMAALAAAIGLSSAAAVVARSYEEHLSTQADLLATNRIIARIDDVLAQAGRFDLDPIPLVVVFRYAVLSGPVGGVTTARQSDWSKEAIFHFIDRRFVGVRDQPERYLRALQVAQYHREWPAMDSVFFEEGVVTVVIKK